MAIEYRTEPEFIEYLDGEAHPKVSPRFEHGLVQAQVLRILADCVGNRGRVATELDAIVGKVDGTHSKFVPDVSYVSFDRMAAYTREELEEPPFAPDIAIEVRSPGDSRAYLERKTARYLATGSFLVLDVQPESRTIVAHSADGERTFAETDTFEHTAAPWLTFPVRDVFSVLDPPPKRG